MLTPKKLYKKHYDANLAFYKRAFLSEKQLRGIEYDATLEAIKEAQEQTHRIVKILELQLRKVHQTISDKRKIILDEIDKPSGDNVLTGNIKIQYLTILANEYCATMDDIANIIEPKTAPGGDLIPQSPDTQIINLKIENHE